MRTIRTMAMSVTTLALLATGIVPVAAQSTPPVSDQTLPAAFTGRIAFGGQVRAGTTETVDGHVESRGSAFAPVVSTMSDPRLDGKVLISYQTDEYTGPDGASHSLGTGTWRIETADGAWQGSYTRVEAEGFSDTNTAVLVGEGAYDGLYAVFEQTIDASGWDIRGAIFPAGSPPVATLP